ncbi:hypothetical protein Slin14017_G116510 [Septoria linicola]|nr:hypothetical protein Slin14017_G116510 [Septoria linicola]
MPQSHTSAIILSLLLRDQIMVLNQNRACWRASEESRQSRPVASVPLRGRHAPPVVVHMSNAGFDVLRNALFADGLQEQEVIGTIDSTINAALRHFERQGILPDSRARADCVSHNIHLARFLSVPQEESVEHTHPLTFDMSVLDLDRLLRDLRLWAYCFGSEQVYQVGVITEVLGNHVLQLFNTEPGRLPTHTIFLLRHCSPHGASGTFSQVWTALTIVNEPTGDPTAPVSQPKIPHANAAIHPVVRHPINGSTASALTAQPRRKSRQNLPVHPHHHSARPYMDKTAAQILAVGSGVDSEEVHGLLILVIALEYRNCEIRDLLNNKRVHEEGRDTFKKGSNTILQRIKHALQHSFGAENYESNFDSYKTARSGDAAAKAQWLKTLHDPAARTLRAAASCNLCNKSMTHRSKTATSSPDTDAYPLSDGISPQAADTDAALPQHTVNSQGAIITQPENGNFTGVTSSGESLDTNALPNKSQARPAPKRPHGDMVIDSNAVQKRATKRAKHAHKAAEVTSQHTLQPLSDILGTSDGQDASGMLPAHDSDHAIPGPLVPASHDATVQSAGRSYLSAPATEQSAGTANSELGTAATGPDHTEQWGCIFCSGTLYYHETDCTMLLNSDDFQG